jgi:DNA-binding SARP family transcriptional activator/TolB-like protein
MSNGGEPGLTIRTLGPLQIERNGQQIPVPASRKARAILGFLILSPRPVGRQRLCEMFFDVPDDPRASLRWTLTKLRAAIDEPGVSRIVSRGDSLKFEPAGAHVDALAILGGAAAQQESDGIFLEDAELPDRQDFMSWLYSAREDLRTASVQRLRLLVEAEAPPDRKLALYRQLVHLEPLDEAAGVGIVRSLAQLGRTDEAREAAADAERLLIRAGRKPGPALRGALKVTSSPAAEAAPVTAAPIRASASSQLFQMLPGVAIVPFHNYSPDLIPESLVDGFLESTIHMFARFRQFRVSSMDAVLAFKGRMNDPEALRAATGADYLVGGSMMARGSAVKVRYRVIDAINGALLSSGDVDATATTGASMIEEIPEALVSHLTHQCAELARHRAAETPEEKRNAVEHYFCGMSYGFLSPPLNYQKALECFEKSLALAPDYPPSLAGAAWAKALMGSFYAPDARKQAIALANKAIARGNDDASVLALGGWTLVQFGGDVGSAKRAVDMAMRVNPIARSAWNISAWIHGMEGRHEIAMQHFDKAEKYSPLGASLEQMNSGRALSCWLAGKYEEAAEWARRAIERGPNNPGALTVAVAVAAQLNDPEAAREAVRLMTAYYPTGADHPAIQAVPIVAPEEKKRILDAVRKGFDLAKT